VIMRRLARHFREENWFLVLVELLAVMLGLLGAFQLDNWKQERQAAAAERRYLGQLHTEVEIALPTIERRIQNPRLTLELVHQALEIVQQPKGNPGLSQDQCGALLDVSIIGWYPITLTTMQELISGGNLSLLQDGRLKSLLFELQASEESMRTFLQLIYSQQNSLTDLYPELLPRSIDTERNNVMACDTERMRGDRGFLNRLISNRGRYQAFLRRLEGELELVAKIDERLDHLLDLPHKN